MEDKKYSRDRLEEAGFQLHVKEVTYEDFTRMDVYNKRTCYLETA